MKNVSVGQHSLLSQLEIEKTGDLDFEFHCIAGHALCFQHDRANQRGEMRAHRKVVQIFQIVL